MRWTLEAFVHRVLDAVPAGDEVRFQLQRRVAGAVPIDDRRLRRELDYAKEHLSVLRDAMHDPSNASVLEFGAGRHLTVAMAIAAVGPNVVASDVAKLMRPDLVQDAARRSCMPALGPIAVADDVLGALLDLGVTYRKMTPGSFDRVRDQTIDLLYSTSVLEHIPVEEISTLLQEARRVLSPAGRISLIVDYTDHYAYGDPSISSFNFLSVPEAKWLARYSPSGHFQNRLRHDDAVDLLEKAGFTVVVKNVNGPREQDLTWLREADLDVPFADIPPERLGIRSAHLVARHARADDG